MEIETRSADNVKILEFAGRFDTYTADTARQWLEQAMIDEPANVVVNLEKVDFVDSTALATLVHGLKRCRQLNGDLRLCHLQQSVRMVFELTRLDRFFEIFAHEEEAIQAFAS
ncbi:MAG: STAS domain-containing protein [Chloroflexi bacterium]|nr:STAS domain-containing protein [Chloroflexota bacterium]